MFRLPIVCGRDDTVSFLVVGQPFQMFAVRGLVDLTDQVMEESLQLCSVLLLCQFQTFPRGLAELGKSPLPLVETGSRQQYTGSIRAAWKRPHQVALRFGFDSEWIVAGPCINRPLDTISEMRKRSTVPQNVFELA